MSKKKFIILTIFFIIEVKCINENLQNNTQSIIENKDIPKKVNSTIVAQKSSLTVQGNLNKTNNVNTNSSTFENNNHLTIENSTSKNFSKSVVEILKTSTDKINIKTNNSKEINGSNVKPIITTPSNVIKHKDREGISEDSYLNSRFEKNSVNNKTNEKNNNIYLKDKNVKKLDNNTLLLSDNEIVNKSSKVENTTTINNTSIVNKNTTSTTTTEKPKKPKITYSVYDNPAMLDVIPDKTPKTPLNIFNSENIEQPNAESSQEFVNPRHQDYIIPLVSLIFAIPIVMGGFIVLYRKVKDYWSTRHYRRMDFLVDGMYNDS